MRMKLVFGLLVFVAITVTGAFAQDQPAPASDAAQPSQAEPSSSETSAPAQPSPRDAAPESKPTRVRVGGTIAAKSLTHQVAPKYPDEAKAKHIQGTVVLHCIIGTDGSMLQVQYVSGPPVLIHSAIEAVRQWKYKVTRLDGKPVEVDTAVSVVYTLGN